VCVCVLIIINKIGWAITMLSREKRGYASTCQVRMCVCVSVCVSVCVCVCVCVSVCMYLSY